ncbi:MAG: DNA-processing protein DprA [Clostridia bacterium]
MLLTSEQKCLLWLSNGEIAARRAQELMAVYGGAQGVWDAFGKREGPRFLAGAQEILSRLHSVDAIDGLCEKLTQKNVHLLFQDDEAYPELLSAIPDPPYLLYYAGKLECLARTCVAVVGTRLSSSYGDEMAHMLATGLSEAGVCVVSGLARGIDAAAHKAVLDAGGRTIGVLGSGINVPYPPEHTAMLRKIAGGIGLILSEYPLDAEPKSFHFPYRNRIISGLSVGVIFVEGKVKSGGMHTVSSALEQGREVFAVPGRVGTAYSVGPHTILREGARIATSARDVLDDLGINEETPEACAPQQASERCGPCQRKILDALRVEPLGIAELALQTAESTDTLLVELGLLEIMGKVNREAGNRFALPLLPHP